LLIGILVLFCGLAPAVAGTPASEPDDDTLDRYLRGLNRVSRFYRDNALSFSCEEKLFNHTHRGRKDLRSFYG
jgi:hypothetical protein